MPTFVYRAKDGPERVVEGQMNMESRAAALAALESRGLIPVWVRDSGPERRAFLSWPQGRIRYRDVTVFTRQMGSLTRAGVPILRTLATIREQTESARFRRIVGQIESTVRDGNMFSDALSRHPEQFSALYVNMVRSGETAGVLDEILMRLADAREQEEDARRRVQAAVAYPALILGVGLATVFVLLAFFMPRLIDLFHDYQRLPLPTRMLIGASHFVSRSWYWLLLIGSLIAAVIARLSRLEKGRTFADRIRLHLPLLGRLLREADIGRFARTLALLIQSGIPIDRALLLSADTLRNTLLKNDIDTVRRETVERGVAFSTGLKGTRYFPPLVANMAAVGEEGGRLDEALNEVAAYYEKECEQRSRLALSLLEPVLILCVGAVVGFIVAAMLLPVFQLGTGL